MPAEPLTPEQLAALLPELKAKVEAMTFVPECIDIPILVAVDDIMQAWWYVTEPGSPILATRRAAFASEEDAIAFRTLVAATPSLIAVAESALDLRAKVDAARSDRNRAEAEASRCRRISDESRDEREAALATVEAQAKRIAELEARLDGLPDGVTGRMACEILVESNRREADAMGKLDASELRAHRAERRARELEAGLREMLASAHPHPVEHPTMTAAWATARALLTTEPTP